MTKKNTKFAHCKDKGFEAMDNKKLVETVAANMGRTTDDVGKLLDALAGVLRTRCSEMDMVVIPSFGTFEPKKRNERVIKHPATGRRMLVPPKVVMSFKLSSVLKSKLK